MKRKFLAILIFIILLFPSVAFADDTVDVKITGQFDYTTAYEILKMTNAERAERGLSELKMNEKLLDAAMQRAAEVAVYYSHNRPDGNSCFTAFPDIGYMAAAENIAAGQPDAASVHNSWMNSDEHRRNILAERYSTIGIGCFYQEDIGIRTWVQLFTDATDGGYEITGIVTDTRTVTVIASRLSVGTFNPSVSAPYRGDYYVYNRLCPGQTEEFALMNVNTGSGAGFVTAILAPDGYSIKAGADNVSVSGNKVTAISESPAKIGFHIDDQYFGQYTFNIAHSYQETTQSVTCTQAGYTGGKCTKCGEESEIKYIPPLGHNEITVDAEAPTCTKDGKTEYSVCTRCNTYITEPQVIPAKEHDYEMHTQHRSCEQKGFTYYVCADCSDSYIDEKTVVPPTGHTWENGLPDPNTGIPRRVCTVCRIQYCETAAGIFDGLIFQMTLRDLTLDDEQYITMMKETYDSLTDNEREMLKYEDEFLRMLRAFEFYHMGDITFDGVIDQSDLSVLLSEYARHYSDADITGESLVVNSDDLSMLLANYGMKR